MFLLSGSICSGILRHGGALTGVCGRKDATMEREVLGARSTTAAGHRDEGGCPSLVRRGSAVVTSWFPSGRSGVPHPTGRDLAGVEGPSRWGRSVVTVRSRLGRDLQVEGDRLLSPRVSRVGGMARSGRRSIGRGVVAGVREPEGAHPKGARGGPRVPEEATGPRGDYVARDESGAFDQSPHLVRGGFMLDLSRVRRASTGPRRDQRELDHDPRRCLGRMHGVGPLGSFFLS